MLLRFCTDCTLQPENHPGTGPKLVWIPEFCQPTRNPMVSSRVSEMQSPNVYTHNHWLACHGHGPRWRIWVSSLHLTLTHPVWRHLSLVQRWDGDLSMFLSPICLASGRVWVSLSSVLAPLVSSTRWTDFPSQLSGPVLLIMLRPSVPNRGGRRCWILLNFQPLCWW